MTCVCRLSATLCTLALLAMGVMSGTLARPSEQDTGPQLDITTSIKLGGPILGDTIGPFASGKKLKITCSTKSPGPVSLSWWEDGKKQEAIGSNVSTSFTLWTLQDTDSGRRFTCQDAVTKTNKTVKLRVVKPNLEIMSGKHNLQDEQILNVLPGKDLLLNCVVQGYTPDPGSWWEGGKKLHAINNSSKYASSSQLRLPAASISDRGRMLTCRALGGQLSRTVNVTVKQEGKNDALPSPIETPKTTITISPSSFTTTSSRNISSISDKDPGEDVPIPKTSSEKNTVTTGENKSVTTSTPVGQGTLVTETVADANSVTTTATEKTPETNKMMKYLIVGGAAITFIGILVVILIIVLLKLCGIVKKLDTSTSRQKGNSCEQRALADSSVQNTLDSLDPHDLPPLTSLLPRPTPVEESDETASLGGRMSAMMPDDRDHSYYYPDLINNSYYYPKITDDVKQTLLLANYGQ